MICPNCGYLVTKRQNMCPKCNNPLPRDEGEWSEESSQEIKGISERGGKAPSSGPRPPTGDERPEREPPESPRPAAPEEPDSKEEPPPEEKQRPGPLFTDKEKLAENAAGETPRREKPPPREAPVEPPRGGKRPPPGKEAGAGYTSPVPYGKESATFSSELGTDWIEKYARSHVKPLPERAGLGVRFWAAVLDWMILLAVGAIILLAGRLVIFLINDTPYSSMQVLKILSWPVLGLWLVLLVMYFTLFISSTGQTPGYYVMDIRAMDISFNRSPGMTKAFTRTMIYLVGLALAGIGCWSAWFNEDKVTWQDRMAGVRVVPVLRI